MTESGSSVIGRRILLCVESVAGQRADAPGRAALPRVWIDVGRPVCVGRSRQEAQLAVPDDQALSKRHFEISFDGRNCRLTDLRSSNGTRVNGRPVQSAVLRDGDAIQAGMTVFSVRIVTGDGTPGDAAPDAPPATARVEQSDECPTVVPPKSAPPRLVTLRIRLGSGRSDRAVTSQSLVWLRSGHRVVVGSSGFDVDWAIVGDRSIAPQHFEVSFDGTNCTLLNLAGPDATRVNGRPAAFAHLNHGDIVAAGETEFLIELT